jgi:hypothetical protein
MKTSQTLTMLAAVLLTLGSLTAAFGQITPSDDAYTNTASPTTNYGTAATLGLVNTCSSGQILQWNGTTWACSSAGAITGVTAGTDLSGGGSGGNVTLNLNTAATDARYAQLGAVNTFTGKQTVNGNLSATGAVTGSGFQRLRCGGLRGSCEGYERATSLPGQPCPERPSIRSSILRWPRLSGSCSRKRTSGMWTRPRRHWIRSKGVLERHIEGSLDPMFGGSVRKHTFVDGISDVDALLVLRDPSLKTKSPEKVLDHFERKVRKEMAGWELSRGKLAITLRREGLEIQVLPAIREDSQTRIPAARGDSWSEINPKAFFRKLSDTNSRFGGKVVPVIKLAKIINDRQPEPLQPTGYHIESLAIEAFKG